MYFHVVTEISVYTLSGIVKQKKIVNCFFTHEVLKSSYKLV